MILTMQLLCAISKTKLNQIFPNILAVTSSYHPHTNFFVFFITFEICFKINFRYLFCVHYLIKSDRTLSGFY